MVASRSSRAARRLFVALVVAAACLSFASPSGALPQPGDAALTGTITDANGPVEHAQVCLGDAEGCVAIFTDANGDFSFDDFAPGPYTLHVTPPSVSYALPIGGISIGGSYQPFAPIAVDLASGPNTQNAALAMGGKIRAVAHLPGGAVAPGLAVSVCRTDLPGAPASCPAQVPQMPMTDASGVVSTPSVLPGQYRVRVFPPAFSGLFPTTIENVTVAASTTTNLDVFLLQGGALTVRVRDVRGHAVPSASVSVAPTTPGSPAFAGPADSNGVLVFPNLTPGPVAVNVSAPSGFALASVSTTATVVAGSLTTSVDVVLPPGGFEGTAVRTDGGSAQINAVIACPNGGNPAAVPLCPGWKGVNLGAATTFRFGSGGPGTYRVAALYIANGTAQAASPIATVTLAAGDVATCAFVTGPGATGSCSVTSSDDGDGVAEDPLVDGNGDGTADAQQPHVTTLAAGAGGGQVTIATPDSTYKLRSVVASAPPAGQESSFPAGFLGFRVELPPGHSTADVTVYFPDSITPIGYFKYQSGVVSDFTAHTTITGHTVVLHLVDNGVGDTDSTVGVIEDPSGPVAYTFDGFRSPIDTNVVNTANSGQAIPVKWRLTLPNGAPVSSAASFVGITSTGGQCGTSATDEIEAYAPGASGLQYNGNGEWQFNWKTDKAWEGQCRRLVLKLADGTTRTAEFKFTK